MNEIDFKQILTDVNVRPVLSVYLGFEYADPAFNKTIKVEHGLRYKFTYLEDRALVRVIGIVKGMAQIYKSGLDNRKAPPEFLITVDASTEYGSNIKRIRSSQIRDVVKYVDHMDEDTNLTNTEVTSATVFGKVNNVVIDKIVIDDSNQNIVSTDINGKMEILDAKSTLSFEDIVGDLEITSDKKFLVTHEITGNVGVPYIRTIGSVVINGGTISGGKIISGDLDPSTHSNGGITYGVNTKGSSVIVTDNTTSGGKIDGGDAVRFDVDITKPFKFELNDDGTKKFTGSIVNALIINGHITGASTTDGKIVEPVITNAVTYGGTITSQGANMGISSSSTTQSYKASIGNIPSDSKYDPDYIPSNTSGGITTTSKDGTITTGGNTTTSKGDITTGGIATTFKGEMITTGGITTGDITTGGTTTGIIVSGGTTIGEWDGRPVTINNSTVIGGIATGTTIHGGTVHGGTYMPGTTSIYNGTVIGGSGTASITTGGTITGGTISYAHFDFTNPPPTAGNASKEAKQVAYDIHNQGHPDVDTHSTIPTDKSDEWVHIPHGLIVTWDNVRGIRSNLNDPNANITHGLGQSRFGSNGVIIGPSNE